jgi:predicted DNA-binding transcriptional regulator AlpA
MTIKQPKLRPLLTATDVRRYFGGLSQSTLRSWILDKQMGFPKPRFIGSRRYWHPDEIEAFAGVKKAA